MLFGVLLSLFFSLNSYASSGAECDLRNKSSRDLAAFKTKSCEDIHASQECQELYKKIVEDGGDLSTKELNCKKQKESPPLQTAYEQLTGCLIGGIADPTIDFLKSIIKS